MRQLLFIALLPLAACHSKASIDSIRQTAAAKLQQQLDGDFGPGKAKVSAVELVETSAPHYDGSATVRVGAQSVSLPVQVTSDGKTTLVSADDAKIGTAITASGQSAMAVLNGKYADYVLSPAIFSRLPAELRANRATFAERLQVVDPIEHEDGGYFGSGCLPHECGSDGAAWFISDDGSSAAAVIMETDHPTAYGAATGAPDTITFHVYGAQPADLPGALAGWASDNGMNNGNIASDAPTYVPPAKS